MVGSTLRILTLLLLLQPGSILHAGPETPLEARTLLESGHYEAALQAAKRILVDQPKNAQAHFVAGVAALELGRLNLAEKHLEAASRRNPDTPGLEFYLGSVMQSHGDRFREKGKTRIALDLYQDALEHFERELAGSPGHGGALRGRAEIFSRQGDDQKAIEALEAWIAAEPGSGEGYDSLIRLYTEQGRTADAFKILQSVPPEERGNLVPVIYTVARTLFGTGDAEKARHLLQELRRLAPASWHVLGLEAMDLLSLGRPFRAAEALMSFLELDPPSGEREGLLEGYHDRFRAGSREWKEGSGLPEGMALPRLTMRLVPKYPADARARGFEGRVLLLALVGEDGVPDTVRVISDHVPRYASIYGRQFREAAVEAVREWRYTPARKDGKPVVFPLTIRIEFTAE